jgi:TDG/mug DNA glycosylase family protein
MAEKPLPDILDYNLNIIFIGFNPGITTAEVKHHYAYGGNRFWRFLYESGLTPYKFTPYDDIKLLQYGFGSTNLVDRPTIGVKDVKQEEIEEGRHNLSTVLKKYAPRIACYVGYSVYEAYAQKKLNRPGLQEGCINDGILDFVCSSTSGLNSIPIEKQINCFIELKKLSKELK